MCVQGVCVCRVCVGVGASLVCAEKTPECEAFVGECVCVSVCECVQGMCGCGCELGVCRENA